MEKKILVALDYSENSMKAVKSVAETVTHDHHITLLSVIPQTVSIYAMYSRELSDDVLTENAAKKIMKEHFSAALQKAKGMLIQAGFSEEKIICKMKDMKKNVATDIIDEIKSGYDMVVLGRRGVSGIKEFFMGSVSHKVVSSVSDVSVWIVD